MKPAVACLVLFAAVHGFAPGSPRTRPLGSHRVARHAHAPQTRLGAVRHNASRKSRLAARAGRALSRTLPRLRSARLLARRAGSVLVYATAALTVGSLGVQPAVAAQEPVAAVASLTVEHTSETAVLDEVPAESTSMEDADSFADAEDTDIGGEAAIEEYELVATPPPQPLITGGVVVAGALSVVLWLWRRAVAYESQLTAASVDKMMSNLGKANLASSSSASSARPPKARSTVAKQGQKQDAREISVQPIVPPKPARSASARMNINPFGKRRSRAPTLESLLDPVKDADSRTAASGGADAKALAVFSESAAGLLLSRAAPSEAVAFMSGDMDRQRKLAEVSSPTLGIKQIFQIRLAKQRASRLRNHL